MGEEHQVETEILGGSFFKSPIRDMYSLNRIFQYCSVCSAELKMGGKARRAVFCSNHLTLSLIQSCSEDPGEGSWRSTASLLAFFVYCFKILYGIFH